MTKLTKELAEGRVAELRKTIERIGPRINREGFDAMQTLYVTRTVDPTLSALFSELRNWELLAESLRRKPS